MRCGWKRMTGDLRSYETVIIWKKEIQGLYYAIILFYV